MKINAVNNNKTAFKGGLSPISKALYTLGNNDMLNASFVDVFAMDTPRTIIETKHRGKQAGIEMGFREYTGTFIAEFSSAVFAILTSKLAAKKYKPEVKVNSGSWITNKGLDVFSDLYKKSDKTPKGYVQNILDSMSGLIGSQRKGFSSIAEEQTQPIIEKITQLITNPIGKKETKAVLSKVQDEIINILGADNNITLKSGTHEVSSNLTHTLRDIVDSGKNIFFTGIKSNPDEIASKLKTINKLRIGIAIPLAMTIAITNQFINRKLTKRRTGIDNFVGENGYENNVTNKAQKGKEKGLLVKKLSSAGVFLFMLSKVMGIKKPVDLVKKLEFDGPVTGGNAIKTVYGTLILGRMFASKDSTELRETNVRDYLGFLNWLVLGGFVSKGIGNILDPGRKNLFNVTKQGKGVLHWLKDISLKSQKEVIAQGGDVAKNLLKLNAAQLGGIAYSAVMLGVLLPKFNIWMTKHNKKNPFSQTPQEVKTVVNSTQFLNSFKSSKIN